MSNLLLGKSQDSGHGSAIVNGLPKNQDTDTFLYLIADEGLLIQQQSGFICGKTEVCTE